MKQPEPPKGKGQPAPASKQVVSTYPEGFDPSKYVRPGLSADDILRIKECFDIFDYDKSGAITYEIKYPNFYFYSPNELKNAIIALGLEKSAEEILELVEDLDKDGNNEVEFEEFLQIFGFTGYLLTVKLKIEISLIRKCSRICSISSTLLALD